MSRTVVPSRSADWLWRLGIASLVGSTVLARTAMDWNDVWVIGSWVPRRRDAVGAVTGVGLLLLIAGVHRRIVLTRRGTLPRNRWWLRVMGARLSTTVVLVVTLPFTLFVAWLDGWDTFRVLQPAGPDGCRVVVQESDSFDGTGSVTVYLAPARELRAHRVGYSYGYDSRQFDEGQYELTWRGERAELRLPLGHGTGSWSCSPMSPVA